MLYYIERAWNALIFHSHTITMTVLTMVNGLNNPIHKSLSLLLTLVKSDLACGFSHQAAEAKAVFLYLFTLLKTGLIYEQQRQKYALELFPLTVTT